MSGVARHLDSDSTMIVGGVGRTPTPILLVNGQTNRTVLTDNIVCATLSTCGSEVISPLLRCPLPHDTVNVDRVETMVWRQIFFIGYFVLCNHRQIANFEFYF